MQVDTVAGVSILPKDVYERELSYTKLEQTNVKLKTYDGSIMKPCSKISVELNYGNVKKG